MIVHALSSFHVYFSLHETALICAIFQFRLLRLIGEGFETARASPILCEFQRLVA
jgi:hypothetical protein